MNPNVTDGFLTDLSRKFSFTIGRLTDEGKELKEEEGILAQREDRKEGELRKVGGEGEKVAQGREREGWVGGVARRLVGSSDRPARDVAQEWLSS